MLTMLIPRDALDVACEIALHSPRRAATIARRILACQTCDDATATAALALMAALAATWGAP